MLFYKFAELFPEIQCSEPPIPATGILILDGFSFEFSVGDTVGYECLEGFVLSGPMTRTCQLNGTWSGDDPTCEGIV